MTDIQMLISPKTFISYIQKFRLMGWHGVVAYLREKQRLNHLQSFLHQNATHYPYASPEKGLTLLFDMTSGVSLSKVMRDFAFSLKEVGIPFQTYDIGSGRGPVSTEDLSPILTPIKEFRAARFSHIIEMFSGCGFSLPDRTRSVIIFTEFTKGLKAAHPPICREQSFIGMSDFVVDILKNDFSNCRVDKILYPFRFTTSVPGKAHARRAFGFKPDDFIVFYNFDFGSSYGRKNPLGALQAFLKAFSAEPRAKLVFKTMHANAFPKRVAELKSIAKAADATNRVIFLNDYLSQDDLYALTACADVYLSLHRGEGFGLGVAEAMHLGIPAVVTDVASTTEFCTPDNAMPIPYVTVPIHDDLKDHVCYTDISEWPDPDINAAANALRTLFDNPDLRQHLGEKARTFIREHFSPAEFRRSVENYLSHP